MIYKNFEIFNVAEIIHNDDGSISWRRVPSSVYEKMEGPHKDAMVHATTGVEIRFVLKGESAKIIMSSCDDNIANTNVFHVYRGAFSGPHTDIEEHKYVGPKPEEFEIRALPNLPRVKWMTEKCGYDWDCEVVRIIFDRGKYKIYDIIGDIEPPKPEQCPKKTILAYGSSITHGSNSIDMSHSWPSVLAHNLNMDVRNIGMAGSCCLEPAMADWLAETGEKGEWDIGILELGINVVSWEEEKIVERVDNIINEVAGRNKDKPIFVISPFYWCAEEFNLGVETNRWRRVIEAELKKLNYKNVTYINGLDVLDGPQYMSADEVHPNIHGCQKIAEVLTDRIKKTLDL